MRRIRRRSEIEISDRISLAVSRLQSLGGEYETIFEWPTTLSPDEFVTGCDALGFGVFAGTLEVVVYCNTADGATHLVYRLADYLADARTTNSRAHTVRFNCGSGGGSALLWVRDKDDSETGKVTLVVPRSFLAIEEVISESVLPEGKQFTTAIMDEARLL